MHIVLFTLRRRLDRPGSPVEQPDADDLFDLLDLLGDPRLRGIHPERRTGEGPLLVDGHESSEFTQIAHGSSPLLRNLARLLPLQNLHVYTSSKAGKRRHSEKTEM